jgi:diguanylate cyclase (GGDEF)-like protein
MVLLVENSDSDADLLELMLENAAPSAFEVARVATPAEAASYLETRGADCVVVDLGLPGAESLRAMVTLSGSSPAVAMLVLTESEDAGLGMGTIETGAGNHISKRMLEGRLLVSSIRFAIFMKRLENSAAEVQSIAQIGSWELDLATNKVSWSRELSRLFGFGLNEEPTTAALIDRTHPDDRESALRAVRATIEESTPFLFEHRLLLPDQTVRWVRSRGRVDLSPTGRPERLHGTAQDITVQRAAEDSLAHQAFHDPLSGLPNRLLFLDRLGQALKRLARHPSTVGVIYLDIDRFKVINDSLGYAVGDQLLLAIAARLAGLVRPGDTLARIGGDDFAMVCEALSDESDVVAVAERLRASITEPIKWEGGDLVLSASAGVALGTSASDSPDLLLRDAEAAMYGAKSGGRARSSVFAEAMRAKAMGRLETELALRQSIKTGDLRVHYQPIVTLADGQVLGHEALVRWAHPTRGLLGPDEFISIAEETGLIVPLGTWVLQQACRQAELFRARNPAWSRLTMSVNLSGGQLGQPDLTGIVASALHDSGLKPGYLQLEMTESVLMDDAAATITILKSLKGLGVRLGVDDFGTGYSSLAYLRRFPVDVLKIDRSFVNGLGKDLEDSAVVAAIISLADTLGFTTIAEGVETRLQRDCLIALGCSRAQGYFFARPVSAPESETVLDRALEAKSALASDAP